MMIDAEILEIGIPVSSKPRRQANGHIILLPAAAAGLPGEMYIAWGYYLPPPAIRHNMQENMVLCVCVMLVSRTRDLIVCESVVPPLLIRRST